MVDFLNSRQQRPQRSIVPSSKEKGPAKRTELNSRSPSLLRGFPCWCTSSDCNLRYGFVLFAFAFYLENGHRVLRMDGLFCIVRSFRHAERVQSILFDAVGGSEGHFRIERQCRTCWQYLNQDGPENPMLALLCHLPDVTPLLCLSPLDSLGSQGTLTIGCGADNVMNVVLGSALTLSANDNLFNRVQWAHRCPGQK